MARQFQLAFYDHSGALTHLMDLTGTMQLRYSRVVNGMGAIQFTLPATEARNEFIRLDTVCQVLYADGPGAMQTDGTFLLRYYEFMANDEGPDEVLVVAGHTLEHLFTRRIFRAEDDPQVANGYSTKDGPAEDVIASIVTDQCISPADDASRAIPNLEIAAYVATGETVYFREETNEVSVLEHIQRQAEAGGVDFWMTYDPTGPAFRLHLGKLGTDRRKSTNSPLNQPYVYFMPGAGTMLDHSLRFDRRDERNVVYVFGQGPTGNRLVYSRAGLGLNDSPWNRCEFGMEARNEVSVDGLTTDAIQALYSARRDLMSFTFVPSSGSLAAVYGRDYELGDLVTARAGGVEAEMRVMEVEITVEAGGVDVKPKMEIIPE